MDAEDRPSGKIRYGFVRERFPDLIAADDPVEPQVGGFVRGQVAQVRRGRAGRDPDEVR